MKATRPPSFGSPTLDLLLNAAGTIGVAVPLASATGIGLPRLIGAVAGALVIHLLYHKRCLARPPHVRSLQGFLWAPFGRIRHIVPDQAVLRAKRYQFARGQAYERMLFWAGWWNCRAFSGDSIEYFFFNRGSTRFAVAASDVLPSR
jgi:hypothetical protein